MKFKTKTKVLATIVGATMMPVVLPSNMFMTTQVCYAAERMSLNQALTELHDITMKLLNMENLETKEDVFEYLDDNMDRIQNLTYAVSNYAIISKENYNAVRQWHRDKFADLKEKQDYERANNIVFEEYSKLNDELRLKWTDDIFQKIDEVNKKIVLIPSFGTFPICRLVGNSDDINLKRFIGYIFNDDKMRSDDVRMCSIVPSVYMVMNIAYDISYKCDNSILGDYDFSFHHKTSIRVL